MADDIVTRLRTFPTIGTALQAADEIERLRFAGDALAAAYEAETQPQNDREWRITQMWLEARRG